MFIADSARCSATLLVFLARSCSDSLEPGTLGQSYRLDQVAGDALPTVLYTNEVGTFHIISQFIHFGPKGTGSLSETAQMVPHTGEPQEPQESTSGIQWGRGGRTNRNRVRLPCEYQLSGWTSPGCSHRWTRSSRHVGASDKRPLASLLRRGCRPSMRQDPSRLPTHGASSSL